MVLFIIVVLLFIIIITINIVAVDGHRYHQYCRQCSYFTLQYDLSSFILQHNPTGGSSLHKCAT